MPSSMGRNLFVCEGLESRWLMSVTLTKDAQYSNYASASAIEAGIEDFSYSPEPSDTETSALNAKATSGGATALANATASNRLNNTTIHVVAACDASVGITTPPPANNLPQQRTIADAGSSIRYDFWCDTPVTLTIRGSVTWDLGDSLFRVADAGLNVWSYSEERGWLVNNNIDKDEGDGAGTEAISESYIIPARTQAWLVIEGGASTQLNTGFADLASHVSISYDLTFFFEDQPAPDLTATFGSVPSSIAAGNATPIAISVQNQGSDDAAGSFIEAIFLSQDNTLDAGDLLVGSTTVNALAAGGSDAPTVSITIPKETASGSYYLILKTDSADAISESDENNLVVGGPITVGSSDPDDQITGIEPIALGSLFNAAQYADQLADALDVDMFSFTVSAGQRVSFDVDALSTGGIADSYIRLFDATGAELGANNNGPLSGATPRELGSLDGYLEHYFPTGGTYFLGVSSGNNFTYNPITGDGDTAGTTGGYSLSVVPMTQLFTDVTGASRISGRVQMPNPTTHRETVSVTLDRVTPGVTIADRQTWVVIHGRTDTPASFLDLAIAIDGYKAGDQVFLLDWSEGAADNKTWIGLEGAEWIPYVAQWTADVLSLAGIPGSKTFLVGHSWGSYVAHDIASVTGVAHEIIRPRRAGDTYGVVKAVVALDPANRGDGYNTSAMSFDRVSEWSWAFYGNGSFGSAALAGTADESFALTYGGRGTLNPFRRHDAPVHVFTSIVQRNVTSPTALTALFALSRLENATPGPWRTNQYRSESTVTERSRLPVFEGVIDLQDVNRDGLWGNDISELVTLTYRDVGGKRRRV